MVKNLKLLNDDYSERVDVTLHRHIIGWLMYLTNTRPNICFSMNTLSQYMMEPIHVHLVVTKHVIRYLKGTLDCGLRYTTDSEFTLCGFTYLDWEGIVEDRNRTLRHCFIWDQLWYHGLVERKQVFPSVKPNLSTLQHVQHVVKQYVFTNYCNYVFILRWMKMISIVTNRVESGWQITWCFMITISIYR